MFECNVCGGDCPVHVFRGIKPELIDKTLGYLGKEMVENPCPVNLPTYFIGTGGPMPKTVSAVFCSAECSMAWHNKKEKDCQTSTNQ